MGENADPYHIHFTIMINRNITPVILAALLDSSVVLLKGVSQILFPSAFEGKPKITITGAFHYSLRAS